MDLGTQRVSKLHRGKVLNRSKPRSTTPTSRALPDQPPQSETGRHAEIA